LNCNSKRKSARRKAKSLADARLDLVAIQEKIPETQSYLESGPGVKRIISCIAAD
jgi:hypothetical protein